MFAVRRILRSNLSLQNYLYTSSIFRCDKPKDPEAEGNKPKPKKKQSNKSDEHKIVSSSTSKKKLTAELNAEDYANFKSKKLSKIELYSDKNSHEEKLEAKIKLQTLAKEVEKEVNVDTPVKEKFKSLAVTKPQSKVKRNSKNKLVDAAAAVASELGGDAKKTKTDILGYLKGLQLKIEKKKFKQDNVGIVNKQTRTPKHFRADGHFRENKPDFFRDRPHSEGSQEQEAEHSDFKNQDFRQNRDDRMQHGETRIQDFILHKRISELKPLGLFKASDFKEDGPKMKTWDELEELELKFLAAIPPRNYFEELIQWTEEGKLWHFPIDNDQDNEVEADVDFTEHIFLEEYLEPWCPRRGPLRHFMELVLTGLSKNHYLSVEEKKEHIYWYRDYFEGKKKLLQEMGTMEQVQVLEAAETKSEPEKPT